MIKIAHESMNAIHSAVTSLTDYGYYLVHLLEKNPLYRLLAQDDCRRRMTILDNSIFELGVAYDPDKYRRWVRELSPSVAVVPDALDDSDKTLAQLIDWISHPGRPRGVEYMAVAQGRTRSELIECIGHLLRTPEVGIIGISFDSKPFLANRCNYLNDDQAMAGERIKFLDRLTDGGKASIGKPIHLLGCALPQEMKHYRDKYLPDIITSVDTSSPVVHGYYGVTLANEGLEVKIKTKLESLIDAHVSLRQLFKIERNIKMFRMFTNKL